MVSLSWHSFSCAVAPVSPVTSPVYSNEFDRPEISKLSKSSLKKHTPGKTNDKISNYVFYTLCPVRAIPFFTFDYHSYLDRIFVL